MKTIPKKQKSELSEESKKKVLWAAIQLQRMKLARKHKKPNLTLVKK